MRRASESARSGRASNGHVQPSKAPLRVLDRASPGSVGHHRPQGERPMWHAKTRRRLVTSQMILCKENEQRCGKCSLAKDSPTESSRLQCEHSKGVMCLGVNQAATTDAPEV